VKYCNNLPDIPFNPKFIAHPFDMQRFISYNPTGLERNYKYAGWLVDIPILSTSLSQNGQLSTDFFFFQLFLSLL